MENTYGRLTLGQDEGYNRGWKNGLYTGIFIGASILTLIFVTADSLLKRNRENQEQPTRIERIVDDETQLYGGK